ncbi:MAG: PAS domain S-box protein [Elusimicrobiales bacterium]
MVSYERITDTDVPAAYRYGGALPADSAMLAQLLKETEVQQLFESYYKLIKIPVAIIDLKANVLLSSRWQRICTQFHRVNPETCVLCVASDTDIAQKLTEGKHYAIFPCANGLTDCASPIVIEGKHVANVFIGQFMTQPPDEARFRAQAQRYGFPEDDYLAAAREVPVVDEARIPVILDLLERMTRVITTLSVDRKRAIENKALLSAIFEGTQDFIWTVDPENFGIMTWNTAFGTYFSKSRGIDDLAGKRPQDLFQDPQYVAWWKNAFSGARRDGRYAAEYTTYKSGITMLLELNLLKKEGRPFAISVFGKNITDRKQAEGRYRALFDSAQDGIAIADPANGELLDCNPALCRLLGRAREELIGQNRAMLHPAADSPESKGDTFKQHLSENPDTPLEDVLLSKGGKTVPVEIRASRVRLGGGDFILGIFRDITERKLAEKELEEKNRELELTAERLSVAVQAANIGIWDWDIPKNELSWDDSMYRLYNVRRGDFGGAYEAWVARIHPEDKARVQADIDAALRGEREYDPEFRIVWPDGTVRYLKADSHTLRGADGKPLRMIGTNIDLTEARLAEQKLRESAQEILESQHNAGLGTWALDLKTGVFKTSETMDRVYGIDKAYPHTMEGWAAGIHPEDRAAVQAYLQNEVLAKGLDFDREFRIIRPSDKELRWLYVRGKLEYGPDGCPAVLKGTSLDITGRKRAEEATRAGEEKYRTLFETAEGAILLFADGRWIDCNKAAERVFGCTREQILGAHPKQFSPPTQPDGKNSMEEAPRLIGLAYEGVPQAFSRKQVLKPVVLDLNASVESTVKMLKRVIGEDIKLKIDLLPGQCLILADYGQIGQVIMNLAVNARDAMAKGGTLAISTRAETPPEQFFAENPNLRPGPFVVLRVSDTGSGMTPEVMGKIFEPFFTTKEKGKGTGLGLPMVYGIVAQSGGAVKLASSPGKGTTFKLYFPLAAGERPDPEGKLKAPVCGENEVSGGEKILLVEDDEQLRRLGERVLRENGYVVTAVAGGAEALAALEKAPGVKLVITDMLMPGMSGLELSRELAHRGFKGKILLVSGYTDDIIQSQDLLESGAELLPKPFSPDLLLCKVRKMLDSPGPG